MSRHLIANEAKWYGLALAALLGLGAVPSWADEAKRPDLSGTYTMEGTLVDGEAYSGTVEFSKKQTVELRKGDAYDVWKLKLKYGGGYESVGTAVLVDGRLYITEQDDGKFFHVCIVRPVVLSEEMQSLQDNLNLKRAKLSAAHQEGQRENEQYYEVKGDPWWTDIWEYEHYGLFFEYGDGWGSQGFYHLNNDPALPLGAGKWIFIYHNYDKKGKDVSAIWGNHGDWTVEPHETGVLKITREVINRDQSFKEPEYGVGIMVDEGTMVVGLAGNSTQCVGYFEFSGNKLVGKCSEVMEPTGLYDMTLTPPDNVVSSNPELFQ